MPTPNPNHEIDKLEAYLTGAYSNYPELLTLIKRNLNSIRHLINKFLTGEPTK